MSEVPQTIELVLRKLEALLALMKCDETPLPADVMQTIFWSLYLSTEEKKQILLYLETDVGVSITVIRQYKPNQFREYETMANALGPPIKPKNKPKLPRFPPVDITASYHEGGRGGRRTRLTRWTSGRGGR